MGKLQRRYPRVPLEQPGEMEIRIRTAPGAASRPIKVPVMIRTVSCEGMGLVLESRGLQGLAVGTTVTMRLQAGGARIEVPGRIAWYDPREPNSRYDLGIKLHLEIARAAMRQHWAEWVVGLIRTRAESA
ncbi:MAG TPA: PilZ domain-containing protein [Kofleriaceae bacterium]|nr:PilZ domain-containing protein [Kofleriaceae bacterium]